MLIINIIKKKTKKKKEKKTGACKVNYHQLWLSTFLCIVQTGMAYTV